MDNENSKLKRAKRFQQKKRHIERQTKIYETYMHTPTAVPHKFHKKNALNCGDPNCVMCMNPRKAFGEKTIQERKFEAQPVDTDPIDQQIADEVEGTISYYYGNK